MNYIQALSLMNAMLYLSSHAFGQTQLPISIQAGNAVADRNFVSVPCPNPPVTASPGWTCAYSDPSLPVLWRTLRYGPTVHYSIPVAPGVYIGWITLVEPNRTAAGQRSFTISIQGQVSAPVDVFALAGGELLPVRFPFMAVVSTGLLDIQLTGVNGYAVISGIDIAGIREDATQGPGRFFLGSGPAPTSTADDNGLVYSAVLYVDSSDGKAKIRLANGSVVVLTP